MKCTCKKLVVNGVEFTPEKEPFEMYVTARSYFYTYGISVNKYYKSLLKKNNPNYISVFGISYNNKEVDLVDLKIDFEDIAYCKDKGDAYYFIFNINYGVEEILPFKFLEEARFLPDDWERVFFNGKEISDDFFVYDSNFEGKEKYGAVLEMECKMNKEDVINHRRRKKNIFIFHRYNTIDEKLNLLKISVKTMKKIRERNEECNVYKITGIKAEL